MVVVNLAGASNWLRIRVTRGEISWLIRSFVSGCSNLLLSWMSFPTDLEASTRHWALANSKFAPGSSSWRWKAMWIALVCALGLSGPTFQLADTIGSVLNASTPYIRVPLPVPLYASMVSSSHESADFHSHHPRILELLFCLLFWRGRKVSFGCCMYAIHERHKAIRHISMLLTCMIQ